MAETRMTVRLDSKLRREVKRRARASGKSDSDVVREAVAAYCKPESEPEESCYDIALRLGIIGCADGLPADLSTNPKYFEGFGRD